MARNARFLISSARNGTSSTTKARPLDFIGACGFFDLTFHWTTGCRVQLAKEIQRDEGKRAVFRGLSESSGNR